MKNRVTKEQIEQFIEYAHKVGSEKLQLCSSGNISMRIDNGMALVSGTGSWLQRLEMKNIALCDIESGEKIAGANPSMESGFHLGILRNRKDVNIVIHFQSKYATVVSCMKYKPTNFNVIAEVPSYCGSKIGMIPYFRPGSKELAKAMIEAFKDHDTVVMSQHGQAVCGKNFDEAFQKAVFFEFACSIIVNAGKDNCLTMTDEEIKDLEHYIHGKS